MASYLKLLAIVLCALRTYRVAGDKDCTKVLPVLMRPCPEDTRDDGTSCWKDSYDRGAGRVPDKEPCAEGQRDDGTSCWIDTYERGAGRSPDISPCPAGLRDNGTSCWSDAHIYGKGCCCTLWGCCDNCKSGYHDDGCKCRKVDIGIILTLFDRQSCREDEDRVGALCYPKCQSRFHAVGCCMCETDGGPVIVKTLAQRQSCRNDEEMNGALCYPKCKDNYNAVGCCICEPEGGPGIVVTQMERQYCDPPYILHSGACLDSSECP